MNDVSISQASDLLSRVALQPNNRWEGFEPERREYGYALHFQISAAGWLAAALAQHPSASPEQQASAREALGNLAERMLQRRVWAYRSEELIERGLRPNPLDEGNLGYTGHLIMLIALYEASGGDDRFREPIPLIWNAEQRFPLRYTDFIATVARWMAASPIGACPSHNDTVRVSCMAAALWATRLADQDRPEENLTARHAIWLQFVETHMLISGPRLPGRGALRASYDHQKRRGALLSEPLHDYWGLALTAPFAPELVQRGLARILPNMQKLVPHEERWLELAFAELLAVECGETALAEQLANHLEKASTLPTSARFVHALARLDGLGRCFPNATPESIRSAKSA